MAIKVDDGIPIPKAHNKYPLGELAIGQSFFVAGVSSTMMCGATRNYRPRRFTVRSVADNGVPGVRVWRIS